MKKVLNKKVIIFIMVIFLIVISALVFFLFIKGNKCFPVEINDTEIQKIEITDGNTNYVLNEKDKKTIMNNLKFLQNDTKTDPSTVTTTGEKSYLYLLYTKYGTMYVNILSEKNKGVGILWNGQSFPAFYSEQKKGLQNTGVIYAIHITGYLKYKNVDKLFNEYKNGTRK